MSNPDRASRRRLLELLAAAVDGIDGYEAEIGDLHPYWHPAAIEEARRVIAAARRAAQTDRPGRGPGNEPAA